MRIIIAFIIIITSLNAVFSQELTLEECLSYAYNNRVELIKQENATSTYAKQFKYSKYDLLPSVSSNINHQFNSSKFVDFTTKSWDSNDNQQGTMAISANLVLFDGLQTVNKIKQSKILLSRNKTYTETIRNNIKIEVIQAFYEVLTAKENVVITENSINTTIQQIEFIEIAVDAGKTSEIDLLETNAQLEKEKSYHIVAKKQYEQALIKLKRAINLKTNDPVDVKYNLEELLEESINVDSVYIAAISTMPEFTMAKYDSLYLTYAIKLVKGQYSPYLSANSSLSSNYSLDAVNPITFDKNYSFNSQLDNNLSKQVGVSLVIPIYSKHRIKAQVVEEERVFKDAIIDNEQLYKDIYFEIEQLCKEAIKRQENIITLVKRLSYYEQIYEMRNEQYLHGILSITDLLIADTNKKNAEMQLSYEKYNLLFNLKMIDFYTGKI